VLRREDRDVRWEDMDEVFEREEGEVGLYVDLMGGEGTI
jgi:hypothetical protein